MSSQDLDQVNDSTCKTNVKEFDRSQKMIEEADLDDDKGKNEKKYQDLVKSINYLKKFDWFDANNPQLKTPPTFWFMVCAEYFPRQLSIGTADPTQSLTEYLQKIERQQIMQTIRVKDMKCNVSVHQRCYGIPKIPNDDWICELCLSFGPDGKYLRCALCTKRGGAMKPSKVPITSTIFQHTNASYYEFQKTCKAGPPNKKQRYEDPNEKPTKPGSNSKQIAQENEEIEDENESANQYYDFHDLKEFTEEELKNEPKPHYVWCHITCTLWTPECFFDDKNYYTNIKGLENIDKQRFKLECSVCKQKKSGSCVQCAKTKCMEAFHPECARRANIYMEIRNTDKLAYLINCERHTPLKLRRLLEQKEKKYKEEVIKFCRSIERSREFRKKERNTKKERDRQLEKEQKKVPIKKKILISAKKIRQQITKNVEETHKEELEFQQMLANKMIAYIDSLTAEDLARINSESNNKKLQEEGQNKAAPNSKIEKDKDEVKFKLNDPNSVTRINRWQSKVFIRKEEPFWKDIQYKSLSTLQIFKRYKKIQRDKMKKNDFKKIYLKTISTVKNIKIMTKEERLKEKEQKKQDKQKKRQQKINEIFLKTQEREKKKQEIQERKEQKEVQKKQKAQTNFELAKSAIRRTNKKRDKVNDKKQQKLAKQMEIVEQVVIVPHNYEPVDETSEEIYCVCRRKYQEGDQMMACEKCNEWYHFECIGFTGTIDQADSLDFVCKFCDHKDTNTQKRKERKQTYGDLFINYDEPNYDEFKDVLTKKLKTEEANAEEIVPEEQVEATASGKKRASSKSQKKQTKKETQKNKKSSSSKKLENDEQTTTTTKKTRRSSDKNANSSSSKISEVKAKLDYGSDCDAKEEIFEDDEDEDENIEQQPEQFQAEEEEENNKESLQKVADESEDKSDKDLPSISSALSAENSEEKEKEQTKTALENEASTSSKSEEILQDQIENPQQPESKQDEEPSSTAENKMDEEGDTTNQPNDSEQQKQNKTDSGKDKEQKESESKQKMEEEKDEAKLEQQSENQDNSLDLLNEFNFKSKSCQKSESGSVADDKKQQNQSPSQDSTHLSKQSSHASQNNNSCNVNNIDQFKFKNTTKQKSLFDFFPKKK